jgi:hypothetical protein
MTIKLRVTVEIGTHEWTIDEDMPEGYSATLESVLETIGHELPVEGMSAIKHALGAATLFALASNGGTEFIYKLEKAVLLQMLEEMDPNQMPKA